MATDEEQAQAQNARNVFIDQCRELINSGLAVLANLDGHDITSESYYRDSAHATVAVTMAYEAIKVIMDCAKNMLENGANIDDEIESLVDLKQCISMGISFLEQAGEDDDDSD